MMELLERFVSAVERHAKAVESIAKGRDEWSRWNIQVMSKILEEKGEAQKTADASKAPANQEAPANREATAPERCPKIRKSDGKQCTKEIDHEKKCWFGKAAQEPAAQEPTAQKPAAQKSAAQKPAAQKPAAQEPQTTEDTAVDPFGDAVPPAKPKDEPKYTKEQISDVGRKAGNEVGIDEVYKVLHSYGVKRVSELDPSVYPEIYNKFKALAQ